MESENLVSRNEVDFFFLNECAKNVIFYCILITDKSVFYRHNSSKNRHFLFHTINVFFLFVFFCLQRMAGSFKKELNLANKNSLNQSKMACWFKLVVAGLPAWSSWCLTGLAGRKDGLKPSKTRPDLEKIILVTLYNKVPVVMVS